VAIDLNAGEIAWKVPFGEGSPEMRDHPLLRGVELPERLRTRGNAGPMVTGGGLVFLGGGAPYLYVFDKATSAEIWRARSGRQFVVVATGGGREAERVAFARDDWLHAVGAWNHATATGCSRGGGRDAANPHSGN